MHATGRANAASSRGRKRGTERKEDKHGGGRMINFPEREETRHVGAYFMHAFNSPHAVANLIFAGFHYAFRLLGPRLNETGGDPPGDAFTSSI